MIPIPPEKLEKHLMSLSNRYDEAKQNILASKDYKKFRYVADAYCAGRAFLDMYDFVAKESSVKPGLHTISSLEQFEAEVEQYKTALLLPLESGYNLLFKSEEKPQKLAEKKTNFFSKFLSGINIFRLR